MALSAPGIRPSDEEPRLSYHPMAAVKAFQGGIAVLSGGYVQPGTATTGLVCVGIFDFSGDVMEGVMDNSGGSPGAMNARVRGGVFRFANKSGDAVLAIDAGSPCYIYDDNTVCRTGSGKSVAGTVKRADSTWVWVHLGSVDGTALAAEIVARAALASDLASPTGTTLAGALTGTQANPSPGTGVAGLEVVLKLTKTGDTSGNVDLVVADKIEIIGVSFVKTGTTGGTGDTAQLISGTGSNAISDAVDLSSKAAGAKVRDASISPTYQTIAAGGTLRLAGVKGGSGASCACVAYVTAMRVA